MYQKTEDGSLEINLFEGELKFNTICDWLDDFSRSEKAEPYEAGDKKQQRAEQKKNKWIDFPSYIDMDAA